MVFLEKKLVTIILINWNSYQYTKQCIDSIKKNTSYRPYEIILIDNGSTDGSIEKIEKGFPKIQIIRNSKNKGFSYAVNQGYREGKGECLCQLNTDTLLTEGWLSEMAKAMESDKKIGVVGVKEISEQLLSDKAALEEIKKMPNREKSSVPVGWMIRKKMLRDIGYLDVQNFFPAYGEEIDWNLRAKKAGYKIIECSRSLVVHLGSKVSKKGLGEKKQYVLLNAHRLRAFLFNLSPVGLLRFFPGLGLIFLQGIMGGELPWLLESYWKNIADLKRILCERAKRKKSPFIPFREPV